MNHETGGGSGAGRDPDTERLMRQMLGIAGAVDKKARDRDKEVEKILEQDTREIAPEPAAPDTPVQEVGHAREEHDARVRAERGERDSPAQQREVTSMTAEGAETQGKGEMVRYDSAERRMAIAAHLARIGVAPELAAVRMLVEIGQAQPPEEATRKKDDAPGNGMAREQDDKSKNRGRAPGDDDISRAQEK